MGRCTLAFCAAWEYREWSHWEEDGIFYYMARIEKKYFLGFDPDSRKAFEYAKEMSDRYLNKQRNKRCRTLF